MAVLPAKPLCFSLHPTVATRVYAETVRLRVTAAVSAKPQLCACRDRREEPAPLTKLQVLHRRLPQQQLLLLSMSPPRSRAMTPTRCLHHRRTDSLPLSPVALHSPLPPRRFHPCVDPRAAVEEAQQQQQQQQQQQLRSCPLQLKCRQSPPRRKKAGPDPCSATPPASLQQLHRHSSP
jgi:hypothetical protein